MLEVHAAALDKPVAAYHEFLLAYKPKQKTVYGFVEGKDDFSFYTGLIEHCLSDDWRVHLIKAGNKRKVLGVYALFDWQRFPLNRIAFFIDRDLSDFLAEDMLDEHNVYITDGYSIENSIVTRGTLARVLGEILNLTELGHDLGTMLDMFEAELEKFREAMVPIMARAIAWRRQGLCPQLGNVDLKHLCTVEKGQLVLLPRAVSISDLEQYLTAQCNVAGDVSHCPDRVVAEFRAKKRTCVRGKYELWFLVCFALSVHKHIAELSGNYKESPKVNTSLGQTDALVLIGPRARAPQSLKRFIAKTYCAYAVEFHQAGC
jgi:hypothetical protein